MNSIINDINAINWQQTAKEIHAKGFATVPGFLAKNQCQKLIDLYDNSTGYRKVVNMKRYRFGLGEYKYFDYPLPEIIQNLRTTIYQKLVPIVNLWMSQLRIDRQFPGTLKKFLAECHSSGQIKPTPIILKYSKGGFNTLHQDIYGQISFPLQAAIFLNQIGTDYTGGEFVLTQQIPRAQSKAIVLNPQKGDMIIFASNFRPMESVTSKENNKKYYRATIKHAVSELHSGERHTLGIIFQDADT